MGKNLSRPLLKPINTYDNLIKTLLEARKFSFTFVNNTWICAPFVGHKDKLLIRHSNNICTIITILNKPSSLENYSPLINLFDVVNKALNFGKFELDLKFGEIRFAAGFPCVFSDDSEFVVMLLFSIESVLTTIQKYRNKIHHVLLGENATPPVPRTEDKVEKLKIIATINNTTFRNQVKDVNSPEGDRKVRKFSENFQVEKI